MSNFLTVASIVVPVVADQSKVEWTEVGDRARAIDGTMRASIIARKRTWTVQTGIMATATADTLRAALIANPTATLSGDWVEGASITVWPKLGTETVAPVVPYEVIFTITLDEA